MMLENLYFKKKNKLKKHLSMPLFLEYQVGTW
jgi:hypothetical protein